MQSPTATVRQYAAFEIVEDDDNNVGIPIMMPVRNGDTYKVVTSGTIDSSYLFWLPIGA